MTPESGIGADSCTIEVHIKNQSNDIARGVDSSFDTKEIGAGDQGMMFGYASDETANLMPLPIVMAHKLVRYASVLRHEGKLPHSRPDMKAQVTIDYTNKEEPRIDTVVFSCQHDEEIDIEHLRKMIKEDVILPVAISFGMNTDFKMLINPTGRFVTGGPLGDTGVTGRKLLLILMVVVVHMVVVLSQERIQQRLIEVQLMLLDMLLKTLSALDLQRNSSSTFICYWCFSPCFNCNRYFRYSFS